MIENPFLSAARRIAAVIAVTITSGISLQGATGDVDPTFQSTVTGNGVIALAIQPDGLILVGGRISHAEAVPREGFARIFPDGSADLSFDPAGALNRIGIRSIEVDNIAIQPDGRILASGWFSANYSEPSPEIIRFQPDGGVDPSFQMPPGGSATAFTLLPDGKILVAGGFWIDGIYRYLIRLNSDGSIDPEFQTFPDGDVGTLAVQNDGSILVGGGFATIGGVNQARLARLLPDGLVDTSFTPVIDGSASTIALQPDGSILVATGSIIRRYSSAGVRDTTFSVTVSASPIALVDHILVQANGGIIVSGTFQTVNGSARNGIARLLPTGAVDAGFVVPYADDNDHGPVLLQPDGRILLGGSFSYWGNAPSPSLIRLMNGPGSSTLAVGGGTIEWQSTGTAPVIERITFEHHDATSGTWLPFGTPVRTGSGWSVETAGLPASGTIRATATASADRHSHADLRLATSYGSAESELALETSEGEVLENGASIDIGNALSGYSTLADFVIHNPGPGALENITFTFAGPDASVFSLARCSPSPLGPGDELPFSIRLSPTAAGSCSAALTITSNSTDGPVVLNLTAIGSNSLHPHFRRPGDVPIRTPLFAATGKLFGNLSLGFAPAPGTVLTAIDQTQYNAVPTGFADLPDGGIVTATFEGATYSFLAGYQGRAPFNTYAVDLTLTLLGPGCPLTDYQTSAGADSDVIAVSEAGRMAHLQSGTHNLRLIKADGTGITFSPDLKNGSSSGYITRVVVCPGGGFLAIGRFDHVNGLPRNSIAKFDWDGILVEDFVPDIGPEWINSLAVQSDGKILVCGGDSGTSILRLHPDGSRDGSFSAAVASYANLLAPLADGRILAAAGRTMVRLHPDGSLDPTFQFSSGNETGVVGVVAEQADGKVVFSDGAGVSNCRLRRILPDGSMDPDFEPDFGSNDGARFNSVATQADGGILVGGYFNEINGASRSFMVRLHPDGSLDPGFVTNGGESSVLILQADGTILTNGSRIAGVAQTGLARLRNDPGQITLEHPDSSTIRLNVDGSAPLVRATFSVLASGASDWTDLPAPSKTSTGWELGELSLPPSGLIRCRALPLGRSSSTSVIERFLEFGSAAPQISVRGPTDELIPSGGGFDFGPVLSNYQRTIAFQVTNNGDGFWSGFDVSFTGPDADRFALVSMPDYGLLPGESGEFVLSFSPVTEGSQTATLVLSGSDPVNNPFSVVLTGDGGSVMSPTFFHPADVALRSSGFSASGIQFGSLTLGFPPAAGSTLLVVDNTSSGIISGTFTDLPDGGVVSATFGGVTYDFIAGYRGGDGNDLVLTLLGRGVVDPSFPSDLLTSSSRTLNFVLPMDDGGMLLGGSFTQVRGSSAAYLSRIDATGSLDPTFLPYPNQEVKAAHRYADGSLLIAGSFTSAGLQSRSYLARFRPDGSLDGEFTPSVNAAVDVLKVQPDGSILIGGAFRSVNGATRNRIARLHPDGSLDITFNPNASSTVQAIELLDDGRILISGLFSQIGGQNRNRVARLETDGTLDTGFAPVFTYGTGTTGVRAIKVQNDGAVLIGSSFTVVNGVDAKYICRLLPSGEVDPDFHGGTNGTVTAVHALADGRILIGGAFDTVNGVPKKGVAMLNPDGSLDESFASEIPAQIINQISVLSDGSLAIAGNFSYVNGARRYGFAKLLNEEATGEFSAPEPGILRWARGGASPVESSVEFESYDPASGSWFPVAQATRVDDAWEAVVPGLSEPATFRARTAISNTQSTYRLTRETGTLGTGPSVLTIRQSDATPVGSSSGSFGGLPTGWESERTLVLCNDGFARIGGISATLDGPHAADFAISSSPADALDPGGSTRLAIRFAPGAAGLREALLTISTGDSGVGPLTLPLEGQGGSVFSPVFHSPESVPVVRSTADVDGITFGGLQLAFAPEPGTVLLAIRNTGSGHFTNTLGGLADQSTLTAGFAGDTYPFTATYSGGNGNDLAFVLQQAGGPDPTWQIGTNQAVTAIALANDGSTLIAGSFTECGGAAASRIARILPDGTRDASFPLKLSGAPNAMCLQRDGRILVTASTSAPDGSSRPYLARIHSDGTLDPTFIAQPNGTVNAAIELQNGRILIGGNFTSVGGVVRNGIARLLPDGSLDTSFTTSLSGTYRRIYALIEQADGKLLIGGTFSGVNGANQGLLARLESNGNLDTGFNAGLTWFSPNTVGVTSLLCQPDGRILASGLLTPSGYSPTRPFIRLEPDGSRDTSFAPSISSYLETMMLQCDGKIVIGGSFTSVDGQPRAGLVRLLPDGSMDPGFFPAPVHHGTATVFCLSEDSDGRLLAGGRFSSMNGQGTSNLARIASVVDATDPVAVDSTRAEWIRPETLSDLEGVSFDFSADSGVSWTALGPATRTTTGWEIIDLSLPTSGHLRATGFLLGSEQRCASIQRTTVFGRAPSALETWREEWFGNPLNHGKGANLADNDLDGLANLMEFALGRNPFDPADGRPPAWVLADHACDLRFDRPEGVSGIDYIGEWSENLIGGQWQTAEDLSDEETLWFSVPAEGRPRLFFRLRVMAP